MTIALFLALSAVDAAVTLAATSRYGVAAEANPLMGSALAAGPLAFLLAKVTGATLAALVLYAGRHRALYRNAARIAVVLMVAVVAAGLAALYA